MIMQHADGRESLGDGIDRIGDAHVVVVHGLVERRKVRAAPVDAVVARSKRKQSRLNGARQRRA